MTEKQLNNNIKAYHIANFFKGFMTTIPIWVSFYSGFLTIPQMALLQTFQFSTRFIFELPTGAFSDLFGRKASYVFGTIIWGASIFFIGQSQSAIQLITFVLLAEVGRTFISGSQTAWIFDSLKEHGKEKDMVKVKSLTNVFFQSAMATSMILGGYTYALYQSLPYTISAVALLLASATVFLLGTEPKIDSKNFTFMNYISQTKDGFTEIFKTKYVAYLSIFYIVLGGTVNSAQKFFNQTYATEIGFSDIEKGWLFSGIRVASLALIFFWSRSKLFSRDKSIILFTILIIIFFIPAAIGSKWLGAFLLLGLTIGNSARMTILTQFVNEELRSRVRSTALSSLEMMVSFALIIILLISSFLVQLFSIGAVLSFIGLVSSAILIPLSIWLVQYKKNESFLSRVKKFIYVQLLRRKLHIDEVLLGDDLDG